MRVWRRVTSDFINSTWLCRRSARPTPRPLHLAWGASAERRSSFYPLGVNCDHRAGGRGYLTPDINFTVGFTSSTNTAAAPSEMNTVTPNSVGSGNDSYSDAAVPAR